MFLNKEKISLILDDIDIEFSDVFLSFNDASGDSYLVFQDLSCSFEKGKFYFITGASGAGKTSLLKLIYKDLLPDKGFIRVFGKNIDNLSLSEILTLRRSIGLIFQDIRLCPHLTILDNVALPMKICGVSLRDSRDVAFELLRWVGVQDKFKSLPNCLSDGQKQRVVIARSIINKPMIILADEPTGNLDELNSEKVFALLEEMNKAGTTVLMTTHNRKFIDSRNFTEIKIENCNICEKINDELEEIKRAV